MIYDPTCAVAQVLLVLGACSLLLLGNIILELSAVITIRDIKACAVSPLTTCAYFVEAGARTVKGNE